MRVAFHLDSGSWVMTYNLEKDDGRTVGLGVCLDRSLSSGHQCQRRPSFHPLTDDAETRQDSYVGGAAPGLWRSNSKKPLHRKLG